MVIIRFIIKVDGSVTDVKVAKGNNEALVEEAIRVIIKSSGKWIPATRGGKPVNSYGQVPITFSLEY